MSDRELLELAAKAAGIGEVCWNEPVLAYEGGPLLKHGGLWDYKTGSPLWNPLTDDGDRYRLAKKRDIRIHFGPAYVTYAVNGISKLLRWPEDVADDAYAIVGAAAEIAKAMP